MNIPKIELISEIMTCFPRSVREIHMSIIEDVFYIISIPA